MLESACLREDLRCTFGFVEYYGQFLSSPLNLPSVAIRYPRTAGLKVNKYYNYSLTVPRIINLMHGKRAR